ncbi:hypothetical protein [Rhodococcus sp. NPDC058521]|uniref:hypothetical protein n=1 Tax=Rhodococcus sp. NPDC058521 TaxID=3346536 RepID=UPI00364C18A6
MNIEQLHRLVAVDGPFSSIYFSDPGRSVSAVEREAHWWDVAHGLVELHIPPVHIEHAAATVLDETPPSTHVGRAVITNDQQTWLDHILSWVPETVVARHSRLPHLFPLIESELTEDLGPITDHHSRSARRLEGLADVCRALRSGAVDTLEVGNLRNEVVFVGDLPNWVATEADVLVELGSVAITTELAVEALPYAAVATESAIVLLHDRATSNCACAASIRGVPATGRLKTHADQGHRSGRG